MNTDRMAYTLLVSAALVFCVLFAGCSFCKVATNAPTLECKAYNALTNCGPQAAALIIYAIPFIAAQDWAGLFAMIEQKAPREAACVIGALETQTAGKYLLVAKYKLYKMSKTAPPPAALPPAPAAK